MSSNTKKYGLQLRVPPQQKKQLARPPIPTPLGFNDDGDEDNVERDILRQAYKNKTHKDIEEQHKKALEEDPSVFDYDGVYDKMKEKQVRPIEKERQDRKPRYITAIMKTAERRGKEREIVYERKLEKERSKEDHLFAGKDKFVTKAYKKKLAEQEKWKEEERLRAMIEEKEDVTKKTGLDDFYFNLGKNVAFGAREGDSRKLQQQPEEVAVVATPEPVSPPETDEMSELPRHRHETAPSPPREKPGIGSTEPASDSSVQGQATIGPTTNEQPKTDHHKRSEDAVAAAKERFLARKKSKVQ